MAGVARAETPDGKTPELSVRVTAVSLREFTEFEKSLIQVFEKALRDTGFKTSDKPDVELFVAGSEIPGEKDLLALSMVVISKPLEKLVAFAGEHEVLYLVLDKGRENLPAEGRDVRRYASEEYMRQFGQVGDHRIFIVRKSRLAEEASDAVGQLLPNRTFLR
jgi:hypothetical protein